MGQRADTAVFVKQRFGNAPIRVYLDTTGTIAKAFGVPAHPAYRFVTAQGRLTTARPAGFLLK